MVSRRILFKGEELVDPDPDMSLDDVRKLYANIHPELNNAVIVYPDQEGGEYQFAPKGGGGASTSSTVEFKTSVGKKG
jgi:PRTRC genetic system protein C